MQISNISGIDKNEVKAQAAGRWDQIALRLAPEIARAAERPGKIHIDCPLHGGRGDFRVFRDFLETGGGICTCGTWPDGISLIGAMNGWPFAKALSEIAEALSLAEMPRQPKRGRHIQKRGNAREDAAIRQRLSALWGSACSARSPRADPLWRYLALRGLRWPAGVRDVRFHAAMGYYEEGGLVGYFPGMLARVTAPDGTPVSIHRTFLSGDGRKAEVGMPKKLCTHPDSSTLNGSAIRLFNAGETLGVAEGIETALAAKELFSVPCWSAISAGLMEHFVPPPGVRRVIVFADRDRPTKSHPLGHGQEAAGRLAERLLKGGIRAEVKLPPDEIPANGKGIDWLDVLVNVKAKRAA